MDLKPARYNKKIKKEILGIALLFVIIIGIMELYNYYNRNPFLIELQQIVEEQYGTDFSVTINCSKNEKISVIEIEATDEIYLRSDVFSKVDNLQKVVYDYVKHNREQFCDIYSIKPEYDNQYQEKEGLKLRFNNSDYSNSSGLLHVFLFFNKLEYKDKNEEGFNSLLINVCSRQPDSHYSNIKTSVLVNFADINYLQCGNIFVDDTSFIKK